MESESETQVDRVDPLLEQQSLKAIVDVDDLLDNIFCTGEIRLFMLSVLTFRNY